MAHRTIYSVGMSLSMAIGSQWELYTRMATARIAARCGMVSGVNDTVTLNRADGDGDGNGSAGGIFVEAAAGTSLAHVTLSNTIVAGNFKGLAAAASDVAGVFDPSSSFDMIGAIDGSSGLTSSGSRYGTAASPLDAGLLPGFSICPGP